VPRMPEPATGTLNPVDASQLQINSPQQPPPVQQPAVQQPPPQEPPQQQPQPQAQQQQQQPAPEGQPGGTVGSQPPGNETPVRRRGGPQPYQR
jgi:general secretion pathway protein C